MGSGWLQHQEGAAAGGAAGDDEIDDEELLQLAFEDMQAAPQVQCPDRTPPPPPPRPRGSTASTDAS